MTIGALPCLTNRIAARTAFVLICLLGPVSERAPVRLVGTAQAQVATQPQTQTVQASSYTMPPDAVPPPGTGPPVTIPRPGSPLSDAELERLKNLPGGPPTPGATPIPPARSQAPQPNAAQPPDVVTTCPTNSTDGGGPPDIIGAAGPFTIVVTTNVSIRPVLCHVGVGYYLQGRPNRLPEPILRCVPGSNRHVLVAVQGRVKEPVDIILRSSKCPLGFSLCRFDERCQAALVHHGQSSSWIRSSPFNSENPHAERAIGHPDVLDTGNRWFRFGQHGPSDRSGCKRHRLFLG